MVHETRGPRRLNRRFFAVWITLALALAIVAVAIPQRRQADVSDTDKWIPMRVLTPQAAAALLGHGASLTRIDADTVDLVTGVYLVPADSPDSADPSIKLVRHGKEVWQTISASWADYSLRYRLDRAPLERELGGRPLTAFLDPKARLERISFRSEWLPLYAAFEVALLWATLLLAWLIVRFLRPLPLVAPALLLLVIGFVGVVLAYAPALFDGDFFLQRWAVEPIALYLIFLGLPALLFASALSLMALLGIAVLRWVKRGTSRGWRIAVSWTPLGLLLLIGLAAHWHATVVERRILDRIAGSLHFDEAILSDARSVHQTVGDGVRLVPSRLPPHLRRFLADTIAGMPTVPEGSVVLLLPVEGKDYLFLERRSEFTYMDFREPVAQISQTEIDIMRATNRPYTSSLYEQAQDLALRYSADRFSGRPLLDSHGRLRALIYIERSVRLVPWREEHVSQIDSGSTPLVRALRDCCQSALPRQTLRALPT